MDDKVIYISPQMEFICFSKDDVFCTESVTLSVNNINETEGWSRYFGGSGISSSDS